MRGQISFKKGLILVFVSITVVYNLNYGLKYCFSSLFQFLSKHNPLEESAQFKIVRITRIKSENDCSCRSNEELEFIEFSKRQQTSSAVLFLGPDLDVLKSYELSRDFDNSNLTCGIFNSLRRGPRQKVIAYSLYGNNQFYYNKLFNLTQIIADKYPGWIMRVYYDDKTVDPRIICKIECAKRQRGERAGEYLDNADFCNINKIPTGLRGSWSASYMHGMMWRWLPIGDAFVDVFSSRDSDSFILDRELASVNEWLNSNTLFHIMRGNELFDCFN